MRRSLSPCFFRWRTMTSPAARPPTPAYGALMGADEEGDSPSSYEAPPTYEDPEQKAIIVTLHHYAYIHPTATGPLLTTQTNAVTKTSHTTLLDFILAAVQQLNPPEVGDYHVGVMARSKRHGVGVEHIPVDAGNWDAVRGLVMREEVEVFVGMGKKVESLDVGRRMRCGMLKMARKVMKLPRF